MSNLLLNDWILDTSEALVKEALGAMAHIVEKSENKEEVFSLLSSKFLEIYLGSLVYSTLSDLNDEKLHKTVKYELTYQNYKDIKALIQNSIANAFSNAMGKFSGVQTDYYCQIKPTGQPVNKMPI